jgi:exoribonuclease R
MLDAGVGLLRTLPEPDDHTVRKLRRAAPALGVDWPEGMLPGEILAGLDARQPRHAAFLDLAAELLRGAGYTPFDGAAPAEPGHAGVGAPYAHVTAPIRRLGDRFATEVCLAVAAGRPVPGWVREALPLLPDLQADSGRRAKAVERAAVDHVEAWLLAERVGETFDAAVVEHDRERDRSTVVIDDPAVRARCDGRPPLGDRVPVRLVQADLATRTVRFAPA